MGEFRIGRPDDSELAPHAIAYSNLVKGEDVLTALREQIGQTIALVKPLGDEHASNFRFAPGKWTIKETIGHLSDAERILSARALRIARGDQTPLPGFEQDSFVVAARSNDRQLDDLLDELHIIRHSSVALFRSLPQEAWMRRGRASGWDLSVRGIAFTIAGHEAHHFKTFQERYVRA